MGSQFKTTSLQRQFEVTTSTMKLLLVCIVFMTLKWEAEAACCAKVRVNRVAGASTIAWAAQENLYDTYSLIGLVEDGRNCMKPLIKAIQFGRLVANGKLDLGSIAAKKFLLVTQLPIGNTRRMDDGYLPMMDLL